MKLIDADALRKDVLALPNCYNGFSDAYDKSLIIELIDEQIIVDAVPVVRCDKCRHHYERGRDIVCALSDDVVMSDDYCSYWERRSDERVHSADIR